MARTVLILVLLLVLWRPAGAQDYAWPVVGVYDGDTLKVRLPGLPDELQPVSVRVRGIDAPEAGSRARCDRERGLADRATAELEALALRSGAVTFRNLAWDKYGGRIDATVLVNGQDVGPVMIEAGLARAYEGGARQGWCG